MMTPNEEIRRELEEIAPYLAKQDLSLGFKVPRGYFDELPEAVLEGVSPLASIKKEAFKVPANYFESLPDLVLERVAPNPVQEETAEPVGMPQRNWLDEILDSIAVLFQPRYALRLAGIAVLIVAGFFMVQNSFDGDSSSSIMASAEQDPYLEYGLSIEDLTDNDLALLLSETTDPGTDQSNDPSIDDLLNNIDLDDLTDEDLEAFM